MNLLILMFLLLTVAAEDDSQTVDNIEVEDLSQVEIRDDSVVLTCPHKSDAVKWLHENKDIQSKLKHSYVIQAQDGTAKGFYACQSDKKKHYFYIKARVCKNCHELSGSLAGGVIIADLLFTGGVILIVFFWSQRKKDPVSNAPRPPNPDYEALNPKTQNRDVYAGIK
ncbi:T-cell surface glycoprotein CD3 epsilon chain-like [Triplophysa dalaica]|uniref:T-cell surface glycoprotein CD3 epsilon chain-like n=1 Tax=Triplophysa dalaica TaxID=1582913 RepID=UPI0024DFD4FF|nr:T-cell surface glycoprotein CD3 epsilon chain-like [Triplophysa dalaica]